MAHRVRRAFNALCVVVWSACQATEHRSCEQADSDAGDPCCNDSRMCEGEQRQRDECGKADVEGETAPRAWHFASGVDVACRCVRILSVVHWRGDGLLVCVPDTWT